MISSFVLVWTFIDLRGEGREQPPNVSKKGKYEKYVVFIYIESFEISFFVIKFDNTFCKGFYYNFSTQKAPASGGFEPLLPPRGSHTPIPPILLCPS